MSKHSILGGKVHVYKRTGSPKWQCAAFLNGKNHRTTTKTESLSQATEFAEDWYLELRGKHRGASCSTRDPLLTPQGSLRVNTR